MNSSTTSSTTQRITSQRDYTNGISTATFSVTETKQGLTTPVPCTFGLLIPTAKPMPYSPSTMYFRIALTDIFYLSEFNDLKSHNSTALQTFLLQVLRIDYAAHSNGKFSSLNIITIQPPYWGESTWFWNPNQIIAAFGCVIVDYQAIFSQDLTPMERQKLLDITTGYSDGDVPTFRGRYGSIPLVTTRVSKVGYITPENLVLTETTPCTIYAAENVCKNGGQCTTYDHINPTCLCMDNYKGQWCQYWVTRTVGKDWSDKLIVFVTLCGLILILIVALIGAYCYKRCKLRNTMWFPPSNQERHFSGPGHNQLKVPYFVGAHGGLQVQLNSKYFVIIRQICFQIPQVTTNSIPMKPISHRRMAF